MFQITLILYFTLIVVNGSVIYSHYSNVLFSHILQHNFFIVLALFERQLVVMYNNCHGDIYPMVLSMCRNAILSLYSLFTGIC